MFCGNICVKATRGKSRLIEPCLSDSSNVDRVLRTVVGSTPHERNEVHPYQFARCCKICRIHVVCQRDRRVRSDPMEFVGGRSEARGVAGYSTAACDCSGIAGTSLRSPIWARSGLRGFAIEGYTVAKDRNVSHERLALL